MKKTVFIKNAAILTATSLLLRFAGIIFKVWLSGKVGSEGIGLYQLIFSVYVLAATFATSGISTAVTRLCSEEIAKGNPQNCRKVLQKSILLSLSIAAMSAAAIIFGADFIATTVLGDSRAIAAVRILPLSLPFMAISSVLRGYFISRRKIFPNSIGQILEQTARIIIIVLFINSFIKKGLAACCFGIILGDSLAEAFGFLLLFVSYFVDIKGFKNLPFNIENGVLRRILHISVPITSGRYLNSLLRTGENVLVPKYLSKYRFSTKNALSQFGMIKGMALPLLFFPSAILNAVSTLLIPEISEAVTNQNRRAVKSASEKVIKLTLLCGIMCGVLFFFGGERLGVLIYKDTDVGFLLKSLSPIVPLMYLDSICDGILKGLDQQSYTFKTAVSDSAVRIALIIFILPKLGIRGFILIMYFSNLYTCLLNVGRLIKISGAKLKILNDLLLPLLSAVTVSMVSTTVLGFLDIENNLVYIMFLCGFSTAFYTILLYFLEIIPQNRIKTAINMVKNR